MHSPLEQFLIKQVIPIHFAGYDLSFTNSALLMFISTGLILWLQAESIRSSQAIPNRLQALYEISFDFISKMVKDNTGENWKKYFPFVLSIFLFILTGNLCGMIPGSFTFTSHIAVTASLALMVFIVITIVGFLNHGFGFLRLFCPKNVPILVIPLLVPVEIIAYFFRPITLAIRLCANMTAGHMVLKLFGGFSAAIGLIGFIAPFSFLIFFTAFEFFVAFLQAYVFTILTCIYLHDSIHLH